MLENKPNYTQNGHGKIKAYLDMEYSIIKVHKEISQKLFKNNEKKSLKVSSLDLFNTKELSGENAKIFLQTIKNILQEIQQETGKIFFDEQKSEVTKEGLNYLNTLMNQALEYYTKYLLRNIGNNFAKNRSKSKTNQIEFANTEKLIDFFNHTSSKNNSGATRQINCSLLKIAYTIHDLKVNEEKIKKAEAEFGKIKKEEFFSHFRDERGQEAHESIEGDKGNFRYVKLQTKSDKSLRDNIIFSCAGRVKRKEQILVKEISDPKYNSLDAIKDIYGMRNEVETKEDALFLLEYIRVHVLNRSGSLSYKEIFGNNHLESQDFVQQYQDELDPVFFKKMHTSLQSDFIPGKNNKDYKDVKIRGKLGGYPCEIQITLVNNKNETGYSHHLIFDCKKKIRAMSRLQGYTSEILIRRYIKEAIHKSITEAQEFGGNAELIGLGGYHGSVKKISEDNMQNAENRIFDYLLKQEQDILKLEIPEMSTNVNFYVSRSIRNHFHEEGKYISLYPQGAKVKIEKTGERTDKTVYIK